MKYIRSAAALLSLASIFLFFACSKSSNPVTPPAPVRTFSFAVGNSFVFDAWSLDTNTNQPIQSTLTIVHESFVNSGLTIDNVSGAYMAVDSSFTPSGVLGLVDTVYYAVNDSSILAYGLISSMLTKLSSLPISFNQKWNKVAGNVSGGTWIADTTAFGVSLPYQNSSIPININIDITGRNGGDSTLAVSGNSLLGNYSVDSGGVKVTGTIIVPDVPVGSMPLLFHVYASYQPTVLAKIYAPTQKFTSPLDPTLNFTLGGTERDLVSWHTK